MRAGGWCWAFRSLWLLAVVSGALPHRLQDLVLGSAAGHAAVRAAVRVGARQTGAPIKLHLANYAFLFTDPLYVSSYLYSLKVAAVSTLFCLLLGYPMAYAIARSTPDLAQPAADADHPAVLDVVPAARVCLDRPAQEQRCDQQRAACSSASSTSRSRCCRPISRSTSASSIRICRS